MIIEKKKLPNDMTVIMERIPHVRSVSVGIWVKEGSRHEFEEENGLSHFIEHLLFKGTEKRTAKDIAMTIDSIGGQLDAFTSRENACYFCKVLDEHLPVAVDLLSDIILDPLFEEKEIEKERNVIFEEIKMVEDSPDELVFDTFSESIWQGHPLGQPIQGRIESVAKFKRDDILKFFRERYVPANLIIAAAGNIEPDRLLKLFEKSFDSFSRSSSERKYPRPVPQSTIVLNDKPSLNQVHLCLGAPAIPISHEDRYAAAVLNTLLGGGWSSRLFQKIREDRGLAYNIFSSLTGYLDTGLIAIYAATSKETTVEMLGLILKEFDDLRLEPVGDKELKRGKDHLKGSLMLGLENTSSRMSNLAKQEIYFGKQYTPDEIIEKINDVDKEDVSRVAGALLKRDRFTLAAIGDLDSMSLTRETVLNMP